MLISYNCSVVELVLDLDTYQIWSLNSQYNPKKVTSTNRSVIFKLLKIGLNVHFRIPATPWSTQHAGTITVAIRLYL